MSGSGLQRNESGKGDQSDPIEFLSPEKEPLVDKNLWAKYRAPLKELQKLGDYHGLANLFNDIARELYWEGKNSFEISRKAMRMILVDLYKNRCVDKVTIMTGKHSSCTACKGLDGKVYSVREAIKDMPLPVKDCTRILAGIDHHQGYCNCMYVPCFEK